MPHFMQRRLPKAVLTPVPLRQTWFAASKFAINIDSSSISVPTFRGVEVTTPKVIGKPFAKLSILNLHWVRGISYIFSHGFNRFSPVFFVGFLPLIPSIFDVPRWCCCPVPVASMPSTPASSSGLAEMGVGVAWNGLKWGDHFDTISTHYVKSLYQTNIKSSHLHLSNLFLWCDFVGTSCRRVGVWT